MEEHAVASGLAHVHVAGAGGRQGAEGGAGQEASADGEEEEGACTCRRGIERVRTNSRTTLDLIPIPRSMPPARPAPGEPRRAALAPGFKTAPASPAAKTLSSSKAKGLLLFTLRRRVLRWPGWWISTMVEACPRPRCLAYRLERQIPGTPRCRSTWKAPPRHRPSQCAEGCSSDVRPSSRPRRPPSRRRRDGP